jgi:AmmeMemoRadiSam system protein A
MGCSDEQGRILLDLARKAIAFQLGRGEAPGSGEGYADLQQSQATFVTLKKKGQLRGCIGNLEPVGTLWEGIRDNALNAAFHDYRFAPLSADELDEIHIDISILSPAVVLDYTDTADLLKKLCPGRDGVVLRSGAKAATFLPQVWQQLPRAEDFLSHLCHKAGLDKDTWRHRHPEIRVYQVQCFAEGAA